jgi:hypothetical protein
MNNGNRSLNSCRCFGPLIISLPKSGISPMIAAQTCLRGASFLFKIGEKMLAAELAWDHRTNPSFKIHKEAHFLNISLFR